MKQFKSVKEMAASLVGDGKSPNRFFVTFGYGYYVPAGKEDAEQVKNALESVTIGPFSEMAQAEEFFNAVPSPYTCTLSDITGTTITNVIMEDRKTGTVKDWIFVQSPRDMLLRPVSTF